MIDSVTAATTTFSPGEGRGGGGAVGGEQGQHGRGQESGFLGEG